MTRRSPLPVLRACAVSGLLLAVLTVPAAAAEPSTARISVAADGSEAQGPSTESVVSADGRFVAFQASAPNLVPGDTNDRTDVFVKDRVTGAVELVSVGPDGAEAQYGAFNPVISADGQVVAFHSASFDEDTSNDVFVRDREAGTTELIRPELGPDQGRITSASGPSLSADGKVVVFHANVFLRPFVAFSRGIRYDRETGATTVISLGDGTDTDRSTVIDPTLSGDAGRIVALAYDDGADKPMGLYSFGPGPELILEGQANQPSLSHDGRMLSFISPLQVVPGDTDEDNDIFAHDLDTGATQLVSIGPGGEQLELVVMGATSPSGHTVSFGGAQRVGGDRDVFLRDLRAGTTELIDPELEGERDPTHYSFPGTVSADDRFVGFHSYSPAQVPGDENGTSDSFVRDRGAPDPPPAAKDPLCLLLKAVLDPVLTLAGLPPLDC